MTQNPKGRATGATDPAMAPGALTLADLLQALTIGLATLNSAGTLAAELTGSKEQSEAENTNTGATDQASPSAQTNTGASTVAAAAPPPPNNTPSTFPAASGSTGNGGGTAGVSSAGGRWYTITAGKKVGVFHGWHNVTKHVTGVSGAAYSKWPTRGVAEAVFAEATANGAVHVIV